MLLHQWAPAVLRSAGLAVVETSGWTNRSHGAFPDSISAAWHHDASPEGDSPGALRWMIDNWANASANFWVNRPGVWYCVGTGVAWHAGAVLPGMPSNFTSFGVETDQTVNETPSPAMLASTRTGIGALLAHMGRDSSSAHFHKTIASPRGRKQDPWFDAGSNNQGNWPGELTRERNAIQAITDGGAVPPTDWFDMATKDDLAAVVREQLIEVLRAGEFLRITKGDVFEMTASVLRAPEFHHDPAPTIGAIHDDAVSIARAPEFVSGSKQFAVIIDKDTGAWYAIAPGLFWHLIDMNEVRLLRAVGALSSTESSLTHAQTIAMREEMLRVNDNVLPVPGPKTHTVVAGDTLIGIATAYGIADWRDLVTWNQLANADDLTVGQVLRLTP